MEAQSFIGDHRVTNKHLSKSVAAVLLLFWVASSSSPWQGRQQKLRRNLRWVVFGLTARVFCLYSHEISFHKLSHGCISKPLYVWIQVTLRVGKTVFFYTMLLFPSWLQFQHECSVAKHWQGFLDGLQTTNAIWDTGVGSWFLWTETGRTLILCSLWQQQEVNSAICVKCYIRMH